MLDIENKKELTYPYGKKWSPEPGVPFEVAEGVYWLRMPLAMSLNHINLWLLKDSEKWIIVDTGMETDACKAVWETVFSTFFTPEDVSRIIVTHFHPDHMGLAAWLAERCDCKVEITQMEFDYYQEMIHRKPEETRAAVNYITRLTGFESDFAERYAQMIKVDADKQRLQFEDCSFIKDGDELQINNRVWRVVSGNGHSPDHACLYCEELDLLISGDQALPRISSNVSVHAANTEANPLLNWIASCEKLAEVIPPKTVVLPAHQEIFVGIDIRMGQLIDDHNGDLVKLKKICQKPQTVKKACESLFERELPGFHRLLALGETLAHLNYLLYRNELILTQKQQVNYYQAV